MCFSITDRKLDKDQPVDLRQNGRGLFLLTVVGRTGSFAHPVQLIAWRLLEVHHRKHPDVIRFEHINHGIRKRSPKVPPGARGPVDAKECGIGRNLGLQFIEVPEKSLAQPVLDGGVVL